MAGYLDPDRFDATIRSILPQLYPPGPSPFSWTKITPIASRALWFLAISSSDTVGVDPTSNLRVALTSRR
jgi:hypothetical protein